MVMAVIVLGIGTNNKCGKSNVGTSSRGSYDPLGFESTHYSLQI